MSTKKDNAKKDEMQSGPSKSGSAAERNTRDTTSKKSDQADGGKMKVDREEEETGTKKR